MPTFYNFTQDGLIYRFDDVFVPADMFRQGNLWNWGRGVSGALGNFNGPTFVSTPTTTFVGGSNWKQVSTGGLHTVAVKTDGTLWTWGAGSRGQLGNANTTNVLTPITTFAGGTNWRQAEGGTRHTIAIKTDGTLWIWGYNSNGELGVNAIDNVAPFGRSTPVTTFAGGTNWRQVAAGYNYNAALKTDGTLWTWGYNYFGQLGNAVFGLAFGGLSTPLTTFAGGTNWKQVSCGYHTTAALKTDGTLWIWGRGDDGQLGNLGGSLGSARTTGRISTPITTFAGGINWKQVSSGGYYTVNMTAAIKTDGTLWTWGNGRYGILGNGITTGIVSTPITTFAGGINWKQVSSCGYHMAAVKTNGTLWTWGSDSQFQLGTGYQFAQAGITYASTPVTTFLGGSNWKSVGSSGGYRVCAIEYVDGSVSPPDFFRLFTWGYGIFGQIGNATIATYNSIPVTTFAGGNNWADTFTTNPEDLYTLSAGGNCTAAIKTDGTLWTWGRGTNGRLGNGVTTGNRSTPVTTFAGGTNWKQVSAGGYSTSAIKTDGTLWTWGYGTSGQLGNFAATNRSTPVTTFAGGTNWKQVSSGLYHAAAIKTNGTLWTWGSGGGGVLGNAVITGSRSTPITTFAGGTNWKQVDVSYAHTVAIKTDGTLWTWGSNSFGELGTNDVTPNRSTPVTTFAGGTNWQQVSTGYNHTAAIKTDGTLWTWGLNNFAQLGNTFVTNRSTPVTTFVGGTDWIQVDCGGNNTVAIKTNGTLWAWGSNQFGQLANADPVLNNMSTPVTTFVGGTNWKQVSVGNKHIAATRKN